MAPIAVQECPFCRARTTASPSVRSASARPRPLGRVGLGGGTVEGHPEPAGEVRWFPLPRVLSTFERAGFRQDRKIGKHRWVVTAQVAPA